VEGKCVSVTAATAVACRERLVLAVEREQKHFVVEAVDAVAFEEDVVVSLGLTAVSAQRPHE